MRGSEYFVGPVAVEILPQPIGVARENYPKRLFFLAFLQDRWKLLRNRFGAASGLHRGRRWPEARRRSDRRRGPNASAFRKASCARIVGRTAGLERSGSGVRQLLRHNRPPTARGASRLQLRSNRQNSALVGWTTCCAIRGVGARPLTRRPARTQITKQKPNIKPSMRRCPNFPPTEACGLSRAARSSPASVRKRRLCRCGAALPVGSDSCHTFRALHTPTTATMSVLTTRAPSCFAT